MTAGIYEIANTVNGKRYIGSAVNFESRWKAHRRLLRKGTHHSGHLQNSWVKQGESVFEFRRVLICSKENLILYEQIAMDALHPEYNRAPRAGNTLGVKHTPTARANMGVARIGNKNLLGHKHSEETRAKMVAAHVGRMPPTAETRAKISAAHKGREIKEEWRAKMSIAQRSRAMGPGPGKGHNKGHTIWLGRKHSEETKAKMASARLGATVPVEVRAKISNSLKGNVFNLGKTASVETRAKMSAAQVGNRNAAKNKVPSS